MSANKLDAWASTESAGKDSLLNLYLESHTTDDVKDDTIRLKREAKKAKYIYYVGFELKRIARGDVRLALDKLEELALSLYRSPWKKELYTIKVNGVLIRNYLQPALINYPDLLNVLGYKQKGEQFELDIDNERKKDSPSSSMNDYLYFVVRDKVLKIALDFYTLKLKEPETVPAKFTIPAQSKLPAPRRNFGNNMPHSSSASDRTRSDMYGSSKSDSYYQVKDKFGSSSGASALPVHNDIINADSTRSDMYSSSESDSYHQGKDKFGSSSGASALPVRNDINVVSDDVNTSRPIRKDIFVTKSGYVGGKMIENQEVQFNIILNTNLQSGVGSSDKTKLKEQQSGKILTDVHSRYKFGESNIKTTNEQEGRKVGLQTYKEQSQGAYVSTINENIRGNVNEQKERDGKNKIADKYVNPIPSTKEKENLSNANIKYIKVSTNNKDNNLKENKTEERSSLPSSSESTGVRSNDQHHEAQLHGKSNHERGSGIGTGAYGKDAAHSKTNVRKETNNSETNDKLGLRVKDRPSSTPRKHNIAASFGATSSNIVRSDHSDGQRKRPHDRQSAVQKHDNKVASVTRSQSSSNKITTETSNFAPYRTTLSVSGNDEPNCINVIPSERKLPSTRSTKSSGSGSLGPNLCEQCSRVDGIQYICLVCDQLHAFCNECFGKQRFKCPIGSKTVHKFEPICHESSV